MEGYHRPVLEREVLAGLNVRDGGIYFDGTAGGGGHSSAILTKSRTAVLIATDKDGDAIEEAGRRLQPFAGRYTLVREDFKRFESVLDEAGVGKVDGFLLDLGVSSHQIDDAERGFSYLKREAPLDMRMDGRNPFTAQDVVNGYPEEQLKRIFREYGEEPFAASAARRIVRAREKGAIQTCGELTRLVEESIPARYRSPACARKVFQAIRIEVNGELTGLRECVTGLARRLKTGGRGCVISFHSLEDRIVKQAFQALCTGCTCPKSFPVCVCGGKREAVLIGRQPVTATAEEQRENPRSKSAKLRTIEKIEE